ncbi:hypothetical protein KCP71_25060 [Salmonella enterica subsp. enterica]|nr:hypothetical protein KCP71_25060 [Salmonella enterica subsp. enterica]
MKNGKKRRRNRDFTGKSTRLRAFVDPQQVGGKDDERYNEFTSTSRMISPIR